MIHYVYDSSAILAFLKRERGGTRILDTFANAVISAVNFSEIIAKIHEGHGNIDFGSEALFELSLTILPFEASDACAAGELQAMTHGRGISFGDRACLALARSLDATALTTDRRWSELPSGIAKIEQMR